VIKAADCARTMKRFFRESYEIDVSYLGFTQDVYQKSVFKPARLRI
jgi:hypothetical protein